MLIWVSLALLIILVAMIFLWMDRSASKKLEEQQNTVEKIVTKIFNASPSPPLVKAKYMYGIPSYSLTFKTDKQKQNAFEDGQIEAFLTAIQQLHNHLQPRGEQYDASQAVAFISLEELTLSDANAAKQIAKLPEDSLFELSPKMRKIMAIFATVFAATSFPFTSVLGLSELLIKDFLMSSFCLIVVGACLSPEKIRGYFGDIIAVIIILFSIVSFVDWLRAPTLQRAPFALALVFGGVALYHLKMRYLKK